MPRYIAFLRAINLAGRTVRMERLRQLFEDLGLAHVETFIASGNVIFESSSRAAAALERKIERRLEAGLGYTVATFLRTPAEVTRVASHAPFPPKDLAAPGSMAYVAFVAAPPSPTAGQNVLALQTDVDRLHVHDREVYWLRRRDLGVSTLSGAALEKALGVPATVRNLNTVKRLAARYAPES